MIVVRAIAADDWQRWRALRLAALAEAPHAFNSTYDAWVDAAESRWRERLTRAACNLVAEIDGDAVGMVTLNACDEPGIFELISMWVAPRARGRGVGRTLVLAALAASHGVEARIVRLDVMSGNVPARGLYARLGFVDVGASPESQPGAPQRRLMRDRSATIASVDSAAGLERTSGADRPADTPCGRLHDRDLDARDVERPRSG